MFARLFADSGLSLERLRALVEVGACGSIVKAAGGDPVRQSQYSRQIKELEDFFRIKLTERHGQGIRLTPNGRELARISRFFLLGLSNFQRGCLAEEQTYRVGGSTTFIHSWFLPVVASPRRIRTGIRYAVETVADDEAERRLHDLTLDFAVVSRATLSRPLQHEEVGQWHLKLWAPAARWKRASDALRALLDKRLPLALAKREPAIVGEALFDDYEPCITCCDFIEAQAALARPGVAAFLPDFLVPRTDPSEHIEVAVPDLESKLFHYYLAWNPRLLRLNPHAIRQRDFLLSSLAADRPCPGRASAKASAPKRL